MFQQPVDFRAESDALYKILAPLDEASFIRPSQFKGWSINDVLGHLHLWNWAADAGLNNIAQFEAINGQLNTALNAGQSLRLFEKQWRGELDGHALLNVWRDFYTDMSRRFADVDPATRVRWFGPSMSVRSSITARMMETWAHGQAIYDMLGIQRADTDRIKNIAILAINTFGWSFSNRGMAVPDAIPHIRLHAPSGAVWRWFDECEDNLIEGSATEFCQVAAQVRNVADTNLQAAGNTANRWLSIMQCFAGAPEDPPAPGTRFTLQNTSKAAIN